MFLSLCSHCNRHLGLTVSCSLNSCLLSSGAEMLLLETPRWRCITERREWEVGSRLCLRISSKEGFAIRFASCFRKHLTTVTWTLVARSVCVLEFVVFLIYS